MVDILQTGLEGSATLLAQYMAALLKIDPVITGTTFVAISGYVLFLIRSFPMRIWTIFLNRISTTYTLKLSEDLPGESQYIAALGERIVASMSNPQQVTVMVLGNLETGFRPVLSFSGFGLMRVDRGFVAVSLTTIIDDTHTYKEYTFRTFFVDSSAMQAFFSLSST